MDDSLVIGVDLGGTKIAFAAADRSGQILATHTEPTFAPEGVEAVIGRIARGIAAIAASVERPITGIGIGCPGPIEPNAGIALNAVNLGWRDVPLVRLVRQQIAIDVPVWAQNDVNVEALAEGLFGAARGVPDYVYLAVGTGLGGGAVISGLLVNGAQGMAMEVGHMSVDPGGRLCGCGNHGCAEMYASGKGLLAGVQAYRAHYPGSLLAQGEITTADVLAADRAGDALAQRVIADAAEVLGTVMAWCAIILNPQVIIVGGGLGRALGDRLIADAQMAMGKRVYPITLTDLRVVSSQIESSALGAAALAWHELGSNRRDE
jgi:glucokinase